MESISIEKRYEICLREVKKYELKLQSRNVKTLAQQNPKLYDIQYKSLMMHKYRTLMIYGFLLEGLWEDEVTRGWR